MIFLAFMENSNYLCKIILELLSVCCVDVWLDCTVGNEFTERGPAPRTFTKFKYPRTQIMEKLF